ncbi:MAG: hypothetical protein IT371_07980 [Deltaproteobacteria bacterium]|nr:hypothetical protein [Deltaproteobacteria bacterium]
MRDRPDAPTILAAVARFLEEEVRGTVSDPRVGFRLLVAASLCRGVAAEFVAEEALDSTELAALGALLPEHAQRAESDAGRPRSARQQTLRELTAQLATELAAGRFDDEPAFTEAASALERVLAAELAATNPRFDLSQDLA